MRTERLALLQMQQVCDSVFPVGAFALSNGLETYIQQERLTDGAGLAAYMRAYLTLLPYNELGFFFYAARAESETELVRLDALAAASRAPREVREGSCRMCARFLKLLPSLGNTSAALQTYAAAVASGDCHGVYPVALGLYAAAVHAPFSEAAGLYGYSILSAIVTNAVKLVPLGQKDGQRALAASLPALQEAVQEAQGVAPEALGLCGAGFDIRAMQHETLRARLYMS